MQDPGVIGALAGRNAGEVAPVRVAGPLIFAPYRLIEAIARIDGSAGWCAFIGSSSGVAGQFLPDPLPEEIWGADPRAILAGAVWPFNPAQVEDGDFRVSGQWPYASGCTHASYLLACSMVIENGAPRQGPTGAPEIRILWVPKEQAEILDTWDVMGLAVMTSSWRTRSSPRIIPSSSAPVSHVAATSRARSITTPS